MKKFMALALFSILFSACNSKQPHPDYVVLSGVFQNATSKEFGIYKAVSKFKHTVQLNKNGSFTDTFAVKKAGLYSLMLLKDKKLSQIYLKNGMDLVLNADVHNFEKSLVFKNDRADYNNYLNQKKLFIQSEKGVNKDFYRYLKPKFDQKTKAFADELNHLLHSYKHISDKNVAYAERINHNYITNFTKKYAAQHALFLKLKKGMDSPVFTNYESSTGKRFSLSDFKGKYVFIDVWATWCVPCKAQIPFLKKFEKAYHDKNIAFVSISVDFPKDHDKWKSSVTDLQLTGTQLIAPKAFESDFISAYNIKAIPRFILIGPNGKVVEYDAPKPSKKTALKALFNSVDL